VVETTGIVRPMLAHVWSQLGPVADRLERNQGGEATRSAARFSSSALSSTPERVDADQPWPGMLLSSVSRSALSLPGDQTKPLLDSSEAATTAAPHAADSGSDRVAVWLGRLWMSGSALYIAWLAVSHIALWVIYRKRTAVADAVLTDIVL